MMMDNVDLTCKNKCNKCKRIVDKDHICDYDNERDFIEILIAEVFIREPLWNTKLPYEQRDPKDIQSLWSEVDACLDIDPGTSENEWKFLRKCFVKEHIQNTYTTSGSSWYFYKMLSFLTPTIFYRKTKSNFKNVNTNHQSMALIGESSFPSTSTQEHLSQQSVIKPQSSEDNTPESPTIIYERSSERSNHNNKKRFISESENDQSPKTTKHIKKSNISADTCIEELLLKELELTQPAKKQCQPKSDKIQNFVKYIETCLHEMTPEISKRVMKQLLMILLDEDII